MYVLDVRRRDRGGNIIIIPELSVHMKNVIQTHGPFFIFRGRLPLSSLRLLFLHARALVYVCVRIYALYESRLYRPID